MTDDKKGNGYIGKSWFTGHSNKRRFKDVKLPDGSITRIRSLTEREKTGYEQTFITTDKKGDSQVSPDSRVALICMCLVDAKGNALFPDYKQARTPFMEMDSFVTTLLWKEVWEFVGYNQEDADRIDSFEHAPAS